MENNDEKRSDRARFIVPAIVVAVILVTIGIVFSMNTANGAEQAEDSTEAEQKAEDGDKKENGEKEKTPVPVAVVSATRGEISSYVTATANLVAENEVQVISEIEGRVVTLNVEEGTLVSRGAVLAVLDRDEAQIAVKKAEVRARNAEVDYNRLERLSTQNLISRGDFDKAGMDRDVAGQELAEAQWRLSRTVIGSPFSGMVTAREITVGKHVRPGDALFTVTDFDPLIAEIFLPEREVMSLNVGRSVRLTSKANEEVRFEGRIRQISPVVDTATGTVKVTVEAVNPPDSVRPGAFVQVDIVRETRPNATLVPREAIVRELQKAHVFVVEGEKAVKREVSIGIEQNGSAQIVSGVKPGERVIVEGQGGLKDGSKVKVLRDETSDARKG